MRVAILGGWDKDPARNREWKVAAGTKSQAQIVEACRAIGERLARNKHSVIVGSQKKNSADYHVVHAMLNELEAPNGSRPWIEVIEGVESKKPLYERKRDEYPGFFQPINRINSARAIRSAEKIMAVQEADAVITIGGLNDTWTGGIAAIVARKPVVPLGTFGGASQHLLQALQVLKHALKSPNNDRKFNSLSDKIWNLRLIDKVFDLGGLNGDRVFFGYCSKARSTATAIGQHLRSLGLEVIDWETGFTSGRVILDEIKAAVSSSKYGVFLFTPDDLLGKSGKQRTPRDNVIFEAGYFMGEHGSDRTIIIVQGNTKILADYGGHIYIHLKNSSDISTIETELNNRLGKAHSE